MATSQNISPMFGCSIGIMGRAIEPDSNNGIAENFGVAGPWNPLNVANSNSTINMGRDTTHIKRRGSSHSSSDISDSGNTSSEETDGEFDAPATSTCCLSRRGAIILSVVLAVLVVVGIGMGFLVAHLFCKDVAQPETVSQTHGNKIPIHSAQPPKDGHAENSPSTEPLKTESEKTKLFPYYLHLIIDGAEDETHILLEDLLTLVSVPPKAQGNLNEDRLQYLGWLAEKDPVNAANPGKWWEPRVKALSHDELDGGRQAFQMGSNLSDDDSIAQLNNELSAIFHY